MSITTDSSTLRWRLRGSSTGTAPVGLTLPVSCGELRAHLKLQMGVAALPAIDLLLSLEESPDEVLADSMLLHQPLCILVQRKPAAAAAAAQREAEAKYQQHMLDQQQAVSSSEQRDEAPTGVVPSAAGSSGAGASLVAAANSTSMPYLGSEDATPGAAAAATDEERLLLQAVLDVHDTRKGFLRGESSSANSRTQGSHNLMWLRPQEEGGPATSLPSSFLKDIDPSEIHKHQEVYIKKDGSFAILKTGTIGGLSVLGSSLDVRIQRHVGGLSGLCPGCNTAIAAADLAANTVLQQSVDTVTCTNTPRWPWQQHSHQQQDVAAPSASAGVFTKSESPQPGSLADLLSRRRPLATSTQDAPEAAPAAAGTAEVSEVLVKVKAEHSDPSQPVDASAPTATQAPSMPPTATEAPLPAPEEANDQGHTAAADAAVVPVIAVTAESATVKEAASSNGGEEETLPDIRDLLHFNIPVEQIVEYVLPLSLKVLLSDVSSAAVMSYIRCCAGMYRQHRIAASQIRAYREKRKAAVALGAGC
ncbi:mRNA polyadenylation-related protein [Cyclospora cayetanensis]|uniref:mRNA polyadenylation-related protein n=1 Tax=Cyclospora cayetanensis TaxID=88456 RepID=A0A1D3CYI7_9EIME|nr:mRNA polyadenylation-related protein [Cyclospora cayetanensis]